MSLLVVGSVAIDSVKTPFGERKEVLGGSATFFSISASAFTKVMLVGVVGKDFPKKYIRTLQNKGVDLKGLEVGQGKTFRWKGKYEYDLNTAHTIYTKLNVFQNFSPRIPAEYKKAEYLFLANIDPRLQLLVLKNMKRPRLVACDTMNFWITSSPQALKKVLKEVDIFILNDSEIRLFAQESNLITAARYVFTLGPKIVIIKRGDSGALLLTKNGGCFSAPAYLMDSVKDPTGAGDSFAGGFMGYVSSRNDLSESGFRKAVIYGTIMASFCVQDFGPNRLLSLKSKDIAERLANYKKHVQF
ncbi:MAG: PfkB family carbohydrate kinase [Candidatus Omnitrophica bacterium]|nr:PfkB family carbohydrate kinase [Candidatus Omnitrophota bacterium]